MVQWSRFTETAPKFKKGITFATAAMTAELNVYYLNKMAAPNYYIGKHKAIEAMDVVLDFQEDNYNVGVAIAYLLRAGKKPGNPMVDDLEKAVVHLQREIQHQNSIKTNQYATPNESNSVREYLLTNTPSMGNYVRTGTYQVGGEQGEGRGDKKKQGPRTKA